MNLNLILELIALDIGPQPPEQRRRWLEGVNDAFEKMKAGEVARSVITFDA